MRLRRRTRLAPASEDLDDAHAAAATGTGRRRIDFCRFGRFRWWQRNQQFASTVNAGLAGGAGEQPVMPDAVESQRQDMQQEPSHELVGIECHDLLAPRKVTLASSKAMSRRFEMATRWV